MASALLRDRPTLRNASIQYELLQEAERNFAQAVEFEQGKYRSGNSSINLVILLEDQYIRARLAVLEAMPYSKAYKDDLKAAGSALREAADGREGFMDLDWFTLDWTFSEAVSWCRIGTN